MPRIPLLGKDDPPEKKRLNAFTDKAYTENFDIGTPPPSGLGRPKKPTSFRRLLDEGLLPLTRDHSGSLNKMGIVWKQNYLDINLNEEFPKVIEGFLDPLCEYSGVADMAAEDLIRHGKPDDLIACIPYIAPILKKCFQSGQYLPIRRGLRFLTNLVNVIDDTAIFLIPYLPMLLTNLAIHALPTKHYGSQIYYKQLKEPLLHTETEKFLECMVNSAGSKKSEMAHIIKKIIPSFCSPWL